MFFIGDTGRDAIEYGSWIVVHIKHDSLQWLQVCSQGKLQLNVGCFHHDDLVGKPFGIKWYARRAVVEPGSPQRYIYALLPTVMLYTQVLSHRTQIVYAHDAAWIISNLQLHPGCNVLESGTGSGAFSHHLLKTILPGGHLYTMEFNSDRADKAKKDFIDNGLSSNDVTVISDDITRSDLVDNPKDAIIMKEKIQVVFLDLPCPWKAIRNLKTFMKPNQLVRLCSFSPCIEQIHRTCQELTKNGFGSISMTEVLIKPHEGRILSFSKSGSDTNSKVLCSRPADILRGHTSYLLFATSWSHISS
jgi:tRNA (adenine57-N1/adenine58-N1)-methyltransferase